MRQLFRPVDKPWPPWLTFEGRYPMRRRRSPLLCCALGLSLVFALGCVAVFLLSGCAVQAGTDRAGGDIQDHDNVGLVAGDDPDLVDLKGFTAELAAV